MAEAEQRRPEAEEATEPGLKPKLITLSMHCPNCKCEITKVVLRRKVLLYQTDIRERGTINPPITTETIKDPNTESDPSPITNGHQISNHLDHGDAYKISMSTKARQLSRKLHDHISFKNSFKNDELMGTQFFQDRIALERNESNISLVGRVVSEIEGETVVDRLKRQVEHDKKLMADLYIELEKERNASTDAINQAMAMITKLQEEKAALHTKVVQYEREKGEQTEYYNRELQNARNIIQEKEKQSQYLKKFLKNTFKGVRE